MNSSSVPAVMSHLELYLCLRRLTDELQDVTHRWEKEMSDKSQSQLAKEHELIMLKEAEKKLKHELGLRKRDIDRSVPVFYLSLSWFRIVGKLC